MGRKSIILKKLKGIFLFITLLKGIFWAKKGTFFRLIVWKYLPFKMRKFEINQKTIKLKK